MKVISSKKRPADIDELPVNAVNFFLIVDEFDSSRMMQRLRSDPSTTFPFGRRLLGHRDAGLQRSFNKAVLRMNTRTLSSWSRKIELFGR
ncbi:hypothetical protein DPMN_164663 [Dreissena polymorpha]|uniref:Uncharacterized protein n=1 Tax=Dreissena polymorpha TaxID=45954 RepID=A0A9D4EVG3_DREPO|nr:hypothetical protein DPMN_164663 [Dreissena polymorpha]